MSVKTCAVCEGPTYDADPIVVETGDKPPRKLRIWLCSPECAWEAGRRHGANRDSTTLQTRAELCSLMNPDGLEDCE